VQPAEGMIQARRALVAQCAALVQRYTTDPDADPAFVRHELLAIRDHLVRLRYVSYVHEVDGALETVVSSVDAHIWPQLTIGPVLHRQIADRVAAVVNDRIADVNADVAAAVHAIQTVDQEHAKRAAAHARKYPPVWSATMRRRHARMLARADRRREIAARGVTGNRRIRRHAEDHFGPSEPTCTLAGAGLPQGIHFAPRAFWEMQETSEDRPWYWRRYASTIEALPIVTVLLGIARRHRAGENA